MLNIISKSIVSSHTRGPRKVVLNLLKGLDDLGYPYVVNAALEATDLVWIHDDAEALEQLAKLHNPPAVLAGPNIYTLPSEVPSSVLAKNFPFIQPAPWVQKFWQMFSKQPIRTVVWPAGVDTKMFTPNTISKKDLVLVYNKQRSEADVVAVCSALDARSEQYELLIYGKYTEQEYQKLLERAKAIIWVGRSESQGIGLQEALAMNVPALVWDVSVFGDWIGSGHEHFSKKQLAFSPVTAAPYFDDSCGLRFYSESDLASTLNVFLSTLPTYTPRQYIETELSLKKQATALLEVFKVEYGKTELDFTNTKLHTTKKWKNASRWFLIVTRLKDAIRGLIR